jgi:S1-C subfamily serine protease
VGINTAVVGGQIGGLGFAIPISVAERALNDVLRVGRVIVPWIGISYGDITPEIARTLDLPVTEGVMVAEVVPGSPAARAGIRREDVIVQIDSTPVTESAAIEQFIRNATVRQKVPLTLLRDGRRVTITVELEEMPSDIAGG